MSVGWTFSNCPAERKKLKNEVDKQTFDSFAVAGVPQKISRRCCVLRVGKVPLSEMFGYVTQLRSLSSGRATSTMEFSHYSPAPTNIAEEVMAKQKGKVKIGEE